MRFIRTDTADIQLEEVNEGSQKYAILSHRWLKPEEEVTFKDLQAGVDIKGKAGWSKLESCRRLARLDGLKYVWMDTCCIDKSSSEELTESLNSMFRWYENAECCYVYLQDMPDRRPRVNHERHDAVDEHDIRLTGSASASASKPSRKHEDNVLPSSTDRSRDMDEDLVQSNASTALPWNMAAFRRCEWFRRGWTLQEMLAPATLKFYNSSWTYMGDLWDLSTEVSEITRVHKDALLKRRPLRSFSIAQRMSWAADRITTRVEDEAYSLLGIFDVNLGVIYGEGRKAFRRLQDELLLSSADQSIFAFDIHQRPSQNARPYFPASRTYYCPLLAPSPDHFRKSGNIVLVPGDRLKGRHQAFAKEVTFRQTLLPDPDSDTGRMTVLRCSVEDDVTAMIALHLEAHPQVPNTFYVSERRTRISRVPIHKVPRKLLTQHQTFTVSRAPDNVDAIQAIHVLLACKQYSTTFDILENHGGCTWTRSTQTISLPLEMDSRPAFSSGAMNFRHSQNIGHAAFTVRTEQRPGYSEKPRSSYVKFKFEAGGIVLSRWTTKFLGNRSYHSHVAWSKGRLLTAHVLSGEFVLDRDDIILVEIEVLKLGQAVVYISKRLSLMLASLWNMLWYLLASILAWTAVIVVPIAVVATLHHLGKANITTRDLQITIGVVVSLTGMSLILSSFVFLFGRRSSSAAIAAEATVDDQDSGSHSSGHEQVVPAKPEEA